MGNEKIVNEIELVACVDLTEPAADEQCSVDSCLSHSPAAESPVELSKLEIRQILKCGLQGMPANMIRQWSFTRESFGNAEPVFRRSEYFIHNYPLSEDKP
jgi:hypothetical protein